VGTYLKAYNSDEKEEFNVVVLEGGSDYLNWKVSNKEENLNSKVHHCIKLQDTNKLVLTASK